MRNTFLSRSGDIVKLSKKKRVNCGSTVAKVLVVLVKSRVCMGQFYNLKKESLRVFVVVGGGRDRLWVDCEEAINFGGRRKKN